MTRLLALAALACAIALPVAAQSGSSYGTPAGQTSLGRGERIQQTTAGYYRFHMPGEATIQVSVEGAVPHPGLYEIGATTDLRQLLSLAGGPRIDSRERADRQRVEVRLFRSGEGQLYAATYADLASNPVYPPLHESDTVLVEVVRSRRFGWQEAASVAGGLTAVALLVNALTGSN